MTGIFHLGLDLSDSLQEMQGEHTSLVAALQRRDPDLAEQLMRGQILHSRRLILDALVQRYAAMTQTVGLDPFTWPANASEAAHVEEPTTGSAPDRDPDSLLRASSGEHRMSRAAGGTVR
jgi:hypothetical protein